MKTFEEIFDNLLTYYKTLPKTKYKFIDGAWGIDLYYIFKDIYYPIIEFFKYPDDTDISYAELKIIPDIFEDESFANYSQFKNYVEVKLEQEFFIPYVIKYISQIEERFVKTYKEFTIKKEIELIYKDFTDE